jgi:quinol monooxygenase YgiN
MPRFAQHTRLVAAPGKRDELVAKFLESAEIQRDNPECSLMLVSTAPDTADVVYLTEIWSSENAWEQARSSPAIQAWAASMPALVGGPPDTIMLNIVGGKGLARV